MIADKDRSYIIDRVGYALDAIDEAGPSRHNLSQIISQEIGLAIQYEREKIVAHLEEQATKVRESANATDLILERSNWMRQAEALSLAAAAIRAHRHNL